MLGKWGGGVGVAAVNGPSAVVVSGETPALDELLAACEKDGVWARRVAVDYASHSAAVEELRDQLVEALGGIEPVSCGVPFFSTATGGSLDTRSWMGGTGIGVCVSGCGSRTRCERSHRMRVRSSR